MSVVKAIVRIALIVLGVLLFLYLMKSCAISQANVKHTNILEFELATEQECIEACSINAGTYACEQYMPSFMRTSLVNNTGQGHISRFNHLCTCT